MPVLRTDCVNPADPTSGLRLMSQGVILPYGNAIAPTDWTPPSTWTDHSARDMVVIDFLTPSGYILSERGTVFSFGGVSAAVGFQDTGSFAIWRKLIMNPVGNGQGYEVDCRGRWFRFGPSLPPTIGGDLSLTGDVNRAGGHDWGADVLVDATLDWATKRWAMLDYYGHVVSNPFTVTMGSPVRPLATDVMYRALCFVNPSFPSGDTAGYVVRRDGAIFGFDGATTTPAMAIGPFPNLDVVRDAAVVSDGRAGRPLTIQEALTTASINRVTASSAPTVVVRVSPSTTVTTTSRPSAAVDYTDPDGDAMASLTFRWFTSAQYGAGGFDPATSAALSEVTFTDGRTFSTQVDVNLPNGSYRVYARAADTSGNLSAWAFQGFTVGVTAPTTPTVTVNTDSATWRTAVTATAGSGTASGALVAVEYSDDGGGAWELVVGGDPAIPYPTSGTKAITLQDHQAPFNTQRLYRARTLSPDGTITSAASSSVGAILISDEWVLTNAATGAGTAIEFVPQRTDTRPSNASALQPIGARAAVVVRSAPTPGPKTIPVRVRTWNRAEHDTVATILDAGVPLLLRDPYQQATFCAVVGDIERPFLEVAPDAREETEFAFAHEHGFNLIETSRP